MVWPYFSRNIKNSLCNSSLLRLSKFPEGSSASSTAGLFISALAMATLCCSPPLNWPGLCCSLSPTPKSSSNKRALASTSRLPHFAPPISAGIITFSRAVNSGSRWWNWNTNPISRLRKAARDLSGREKISVPAIITFPPDGSIRDPIMFSKVLFPAPLAPTMLTTSPLATERDTPLSTSRFPNDLCMFSSWIIICCFVLQRYLKFF